MYGSPVTAVKTQIVNFIKKCLLSIFSAHSENYFKGSRSYWDNRYCSGGTSGAGSYNHLAQFKAEIINEFVRSRHVGSVIEFGCGDGAQLELAEYPHYVGIDVSPKAVELCCRKFSDDISKSFHVMSDGQYNDKSFDLALSLDVIYHLIEDQVYEEYMSTLFSAAGKFVIIYSSNEEKAWPAPHVRHRKFSIWIETNRPDWHLISHIRNRYPFDPQDQANTSFANFYCYERRD
jgi:cyclopropane fatty-acyl-phospholipid synthase-like methyltransferase